MAVVLQWCHRERDGQSILPELAAVFGPFVDEATAYEWSKKQETWGGWGNYVYEISPLLPVSE